MGVLSDKRLWALFAGICLVLLLGAGVGVLGLLELLAVASSGTTLLALVEVAIPYLLALLLLAVAGLAMLVAFVVLLVKQASDDIDSDRLRELATRVGRSRLARRLGL